jgi:hypothetical protein
VSRPHETIAALASDQKSDEVTAAKPRGLGIILGGMILAIVLICAYWLIWYGIDRNLLASSHASSYYTFENAFPLADSWLVLTLVAGVIGIWRRRAFGLLATLLAGGAGVYLGCMDVLFDFENHIYTVTQAADASGPIIEIVINLLTFVLSIIIVAWVWRHRSWLGSSSS